MYKIGHRKRKARNIFFVLCILLLVSTVIVGLVLWAVNSRTPSATIKQTAATNQLFDPSNSTTSLKIDTELYTMRLPSDWKQISANADPRYTSIEWQSQKGLKNRSLILYSDRMPQDMAFNKIVPITITNNIIDVSTISGNCAEFTVKVSDANLKTPSKWLGANFLCDLSNTVDNIVGVSDTSMGTLLTFTGKTMGKHTYLFVYTDRGVPEDSTPITTALKTFSPK